MFLKREWGTDVIRWLPFILAVVIVAEVALRPGHFQWDFRAYYFGAAAYNAGMDPYEFTALRQAGAPEDAFPFLYPPITLQFFRLFTYFSLGTAYYIWLALKLAALCVLVTVWRRYFIKDEPRWLIVLFMVFAFGGAIPLDLRAGNVTLIEQAFLWLGFAALLRKRVGAFCLLILASSFFKWTTILFLGLLLVLKLPRRLVYGLLSVMAFIGTIIANYYYYPELFRAFLQAATTHDESARQANMSSLSLVKACTAQLTRLGIDGSVSGVIEGLLYIGFTIIVGWACLVTLRALAKRKRQSTELLIYTACLSFAIVMPRFKHYAFILLIPVAFVLIRHYVKPRSFWLLLILMSLSINPRLPGRSFLIELWWYYPLLATFVLWLCWTRLATGGLKPATLPADSKSKIAKFDSKT